MSVGNDKPVSGLCKATTAVKVTLQLHTSLEGRRKMSIHCHPANLRDNKESHTVQTLHTRSEQRCKEMVLQIYLRVLVLEHEARAVTTTECQAGTKVQPTPLPAFCCKARAGMNPSTW